MRKMTTTKQKSFPCQRNRQTTTMTEKLKMTTTLRMPMSLNKATMQMMVEMIGSMYYVQGSM